MPVDAGLHIGVAVAGQPPEGGKNLSVVLGRIVAEGEGVGRRAEHLLLSLRGPQEHEAVFHRPIDPGGFLVEVSQRRWIEWLRLQRGGGGHRLPEHRIARGEFRLHVDLRPHAEVVGR